MSDATEAQTTDDHPDTSDSQIKVGIWRGRAAKTAWEADDDHATPTATRVLTEGDMWVVCPAVGRRAVTDLSADAVVESRYAAADVIQSAYLTSDVTRVYTTIDPIISADESTGSATDTIVRLRVHHHTYPNDAPHETAIVEADPWEICDAVPGYADYQAETQGNTLWTKLGVFSVEVVAIADTSTVEPYKVYADDTFLKRVYTAEAVDRLRERYPDADIQAEKQALTT